MDLKLTGFICLLFLLSLCAQPVLAEDAPEDKDSLDDETTSYTSLGLDRGLTVDLLNQEPDPVKPGDVLEVRLSIQNTGYKNQENCVLEIKPTYPFKTLAGEKLVQNLGTLGKRSDDNHRKVVKFKLGLENSVNKGKYPLKVYLYTNGNRKLALTKEFNIDVDSESNAEIEYISVEKMVPGKKTDLVFGVKNVGNSPLKNAMFSWECANDVILPVGSSNVKHINLIDIGDTANVSFDVLTNVNTKPGLYKLDMVLTYDDVEELKTITEAGTVENQKRKEIKSKAGIYIGGTTEFDIAFMERSQTGAYTFSISNIGNNGANSVKVSLPLQANWTAAEGSNSVILGNLQKGDYTYADFNLKPSEIGKDLPIKFEIIYTSNDGIRQTEEKEMSLYSSPFIPTAEPGMPQKNSSSSPKYKAGFFMLACVACVVIYKKHQKKMKVKDAQEKELNEMINEMIAKDQDR